LAVDKIIFSGKLRPGTSCSCACRRNNIIHECGLLSHSSQSWARDYVV